jgi:hypothetical protein
MPPTLWAEALHTATYLINIRPTSSNPHTTPYYSLFGHTPRYQDLRVFGCLCYVNTFSTAKNKLSPRATKCVFLGYPSQHRGYRCLDIQTRKIIISRHVTFDENTFPYSTSSQAPASPTTADPLPPYLDQLQPIFAEPTPPFSPAAPPTPSAAAASAPSVSTAVDPVPLSPAAAASPPLPSAAPTPTPTVASPPPAAPPTLFYTRRPKLPVPPPQPSSPLIAHAAPPADFPLLLTNSTFQPSHPLLSHTTT